MPIDQGGPKRHALGVDFGTSNTVAVARWPDGRARPLLVDGSPLLPSAVYAEPDGNLVVGRDAVHSARLDPARFEPNPKRRIDDGLVLLGDREFGVEDLIAAVLARVAEEWRRAVGEVQADVTLTCPATWGTARRTLLAEAATRAGLADVRLVAEPVAAATYFAEVLGRDVPIGSVVVVHDFGAGTFDASVVARTSSGFEVLAVDGRDDIGGLDVDAAIIEHLRTEQWQRLLEPTTLEERRAQRQLWDDARIAKERLSRNQSADFVVPLLDTEVHLTRDELERVARPVLDQTVRVTKGLLDWADLPPGRLAGVFLVGGASRIPLVATLLHRELDEAPVVIEQPELVVAEGSILADAALLAEGPAAPGPTAELRLISTGRAENATVRVTAVPPQPAQPSAASAGPGPVPEKGDQPAGHAGAVSPGAPAVSRGAAAASQAAAQVPTQRLRSADTPIQASAPPAKSSHPPVASPPSGKAPVPDRHIPGTTGLQPPVDPWPDADHGAWAVDPQATVATTPPVLDLPPGAPGRDRPSGAPNQGRPSGGSGSDRRPGSPQGLDRGPSAAQGRGSDAAQGRGSAGGRASAGQAGRAASGQAGRAASGQAGLAANGRLNRPSSAPLAERPAAYGRQSSAPPKTTSPFEPPSDPRPQRPSAVPRKPPPTATRPTSPAPSRGSSSPQAVQRPPARKPKRRRGGFLRFLQVLFSVLVMIAVPLVALVVAYGYGNGHSLQQDTVDLIDDIRGLLGI
jgi:actin-like ATPase involved in cell morphogenesis